MAAPECLNFWPSCRQLYNYLIVITPIKIFFFQLVSNKFCQTKITLFVTLTKYYKKYLMPKSNIWLEFPRIFNSNNINGNILFPLISNKFCLTKTILFMTLTKNYEKNKKYLIPKINLRLEFQRVWGILNCRIYNLHLPAYMR